MTLATTGRVTGSVRKVVRGVGQREKRQWRARLRRIKKNRVRVGGGNPTRDRQRERSTVTEKKQTRGHRTR